MKNNSVGKIAVATASRKQSLKDKSSDLHTTMDFGSVMCAKCQRLIPGASVSVGTKERVLLTSLVAPTMGRINLKAYHQFVPMSEVFDNYGALMSQQPVHRGDSAFVPQKLPNVPLRKLSLFVLFGSQLTIYKMNLSDAELFQVPSNISWNAAAGSLATECRDALSDIGVSFTFNSLGISNAARISFSLLTGDAVDGNRSLLLSNPTASSFFDYSTQHPDATQFGSTFVSLEGADYVIPVSANNNQYLLAFRLSSFGRRLRKNLIGCGWEFNVNTTKNVSILSFLAYYKAYFDVFGLQLYQNWEQTYAYQLIQLIRVTSNPSFEPFDSSSISSAFRGFIELEFGMTHYTDEQDFVSAHTRAQTVAATPTGLITSIDTDVDANNGFHPNIDVSTIDSNDTVKPTSHAFVNSTVHGHLDSKLLQRLYRSTNAQTVAGRRIAELLRVQGLGKFVEECKSNFIGSWSLDLNIYDLPAQSDTYQNVSSGKRLGEFGAFGKSSGEHKMMHYETSEDGWFITLMVVVPKGGYSEAIDPDILDLDKWSQYNPDYDSLGMQFVPKLLVQASQPWANMDNANDGSLDGSFGLEPRYFYKKFGRNVMNGDFSLRSTRDSYAPFCLERLIKVGEHVVDPGYTPSGRSDVTAYPVDLIEHLNPARTPICGNVWRFPTRFEWISAFNRIFYNDTASVDLYQQFALAFSNTASYEFFSLRDDNFVVHVIFNMAVYDQMLPYSDSYETSDEEKHADTSISKA